MASNPDKLVADYLGRLDRELRDLPRARRRELVDEISGHIAEARAELDGDNELAVRQLLDRLGEPEEIAAEARGRFDVGAPGPRARDIAALVLLPIGGVILPVIGWFVGAVLLWVSDAWNTRDKVIGTLIFPGGLLVPIGLLFVGTGESSCIEISSGGGPTTARTCSAEGGTNWGLVALFILLIVAPLVTTAYLARRMGRVASAGA